jgi:hypothetical protein
MEMALATSSPVRTIINQHHDYLQRLQMIGRNACGHLCDHSDVKCKPMQLNGSLVMGPHPQDAHGFLIDKNLIDQTVLDVDPERISASEIPNQFFKRGWILEWISFQYLQQLQSFVLQASA